MGMSPLDYWRTPPPAEAREELLRCGDGTSVTDVATRFGFSHFGRFSQQYRHRFGETPSSTLRRARLARPCGDQRRADRARIIHRRDSIGAVVRKAIDRDFAL